MSLIIDKNHPDYEMEIYLMKGDKDDLYVIQDRPFAAGNLSWIEYDVETQLMHFIMDDGDLRDFGIEIDIAFAPNLKDQTSLPIALIQNSLFIDGAQFPLIVHGGHA